MRYETPNGCSLNWATVDLRAGEHVLVVRLLRGVDSAVLCVGGPEEVRKSLEFRAKRD
jgi:hypothetical protein